MWSLSTKISTSLTQSGNGSFFIFQWLYCSLIVQFIYFFALQKAFIFEVEFVIYPAVVDFKYGMLYLSAKEEEVSSIG